MELWGRAKNNLDAKGRVSLPAKFRSDEVENYFLNFGADGCLVLYTPDEFNRYYEKIRNLPGTNSRKRHIMRLWRHYATEVKPDTQGRILIPAELLDLGKLQKEVVFQGAGDHIELWDPEIQQKHLDKSIDEESVGFEDLGDILPI